MTRHWMTAALCAAALLASEAQAQVRDTTTGGRRARVLGDPAPRPAGARTAGAPAGRATPRPPPPAGGPAPRRPGR